MGDSEKVGLHAGTRSGRFNPRDRHFVDPDHPAVMHAGDMDSAADSSSMPHFFQRHRRGHSAQLTGDSGEHLFKFVWLRRWKAMGISHTHI
ncbi:MAG: hypothetical protein P4L56_09025 [Candidatus Sulfopaludibacter sp.]|nr:hypothetical protein [Candidatus Sulfopaludibacter sp.]